MALTGNPTDAVQTITSGLAACQLTGATAFVPYWSAYLARAHAEAGHFDEAWRRIDEAMTAVETTKERWFEADINRIAGDIALKSPKSDTTKAEAYFERALSIARQQHAKSWELRAAMSMASSGAIRVSKMRPVSFSLRFTAGLPKDLIPAI